MPPELAAAGAVGQLDAFWLGDERVGVDGQRARADGHGARVIELGGTTAGGGTEWVGRVVDAEWAVGGRGRCCEGEGQEGEDCKKLGLLDGWKN